MWSPSASIKHQQAQAKLADLQVSVRDTLGAPVPGAKILVNLPTGGMVTRWASATGEFTLLAIPLGELSVTAPGYRVLKPLLFDPAHITESGRLEIVVAGGSGDFVFSMTIMVVVIVLMLWLFFTIGFVSSIFIALVIIVIVVVRVRSQLFLIVLFAKVLMVSMSMLPALLQCLLIVACLKLLDLVLPTRVLCFGTCA